MCPKIGTIPGSILRRNRYQIWAWYGIKFEPDTGSYLGLLIKHKLINEREERNTLSHFFLFKNERVENGAPGAEKNVLAPNHAGTFVPGKNN